MAISTIGSNSLNQTSDLTINGVTVGKGGGSVTQNTVVGASAGSANTTGKITAVGYLAARFNTTGSGNTAIGGNDGAQDGALYYNTTGNYNIAMGTGAVASNTTGSNNTGLGYQALNGNTTASYNVAVGYQAGYSTTTGQLQTCIGYQAGYGSTGTQNTFLGNQSGVSMTSGSFNTLVGGYNGNQGGLDIRTSSNYIVLSDGAGNPRGWFDSNGMFQIGGNPSFGGEKLGVVSSGTYVASMSQGTNSSGYNVLALGLLSNGNNTSSSFIRGNTSAVGNWYLYGNGTSSFSSDQRLKKNIETTRDGYLEDLAKLRVVKYNWRNDADGTPKELGLIAQEVEQVFAGLVQDDANTVSEEDPTIYKQLKGSVLPFMLLKAIQELKALVDAQATEIAELKAKVAP